MIRRPPRSTRRTHSFPTRRSSDLLITNVMLYVMTDSFASSIWFYNGLVREGGINMPEGTRCETPTGYAAFPGDALLPTPPRSRVELRSEEHTSELQSLMRISYAVFCLKKKNTEPTTTKHA